jgi:hypothetical protein
MNLRSTGILSVALAGALIAGGCTTMNENGNLTGALDRTKAASLPAKKAPGTLPSRGGPVHPHTPPLAETKAAKMTYGSAPDTLPEGNRMTGRDIAVTFRGRRTLIRSPQGSKQLVFRDHTLEYRQAGRRPMAGRWRVRNNQMCVKWPQLAESCYTLYELGGNQYTVWLNNSPRGRISVY